MNKPFQKRIQSPHSILRKFFLILLKGFGSLCNVTRSSVLVVVGVLYMLLQFIIFVNFIIIYYYYYCYYYCYQYLILINIICLYSKVQWQNYQTYQTLITYKAQWMNRRAFLKFLDTITGYLLSLFLFICFLFIFSVNKFLLTIVNKNFL